MTDRHKVVFDSRVYLDDISLLSSHRQVVNLDSLELFRSRSNLEDVRAILEGAAVLRGVDGQTGADHGLTVQFRVRVDAERKQRTEQINLDNTA
jgi:hypothetical protein